MGFALDSYSYSGLIGNPNITEEVIDTLLSSKPDKWILEAIADSNKASGAQLERVYKSSKVYEVTTGLACNPKTPIHILERLFKKEHHKEWVLKNNKIPKNLISSFLETKKPRKKDEREDFETNCNALARNPALSDKKDQLMLAKKMSEPEVLFHNPNLHFEVFEHLWSSGVTELAGYFTGSKYFSQKHANMMLTSDDEYIFEAVVGSQYCPKDIVLKARKDGSERVKAAAFGNTLFSIDYTVLDYTDFPAIWGVAGRDDVPEEALIKIAELETPPYSGIKGTLASKNGTLPVLEILFSQGELSPYHANLSEDMLQYFINSERNFDRLRALRHPKISLTKIKRYLGLEEK